MIDLPRPGVALQRHQLGLQDLMVRDMDPLVVHRPFQNVIRDGSLVDTSSVFRDAGLKIVERGVVDTPPYPDSLGFRDMKLHRMNVDLNKIDWDSRTLDWMISGQYPPKLKFLYFFEWLPLPFLIKLFYAHLFYVLAEVVEPA